MRTDFYDSIDEHEATLAEIRKILMKEGLTDIEKGVLRKREIQTLLNVQALREQYPCFS